MRFDLDMGEGANQIRAYAAGQVKINDKVYHQSIIVTPREIIENWQPKNISELKSTDFDKIIALKPEIVLLGTGEQLCFPDSVILHPLKEHAIGFEVMNTAAACRTYTVLVAEGRNVLAALLLR